MCVRPTPRPWAAQGVKSAIPEGLALVERKRRMPAAASYPRERGWDVVASQGIFPSGPPLNCEACGFPVRLGANNVHGLDAVPQGNGAVDVQVQICGPAVVLRARYKPFPATAICGTALSAGTKSEVFEVLTGVR